MAGIITSSSFAKALFPGVSKWYGKAYNEYEMQYTSLFDSMNSKRSYEEMVGISSFGLADVKPEGQGIRYDDETQAFITRYSHVVYALGFIITREMMEDDLYSVVGERRAKGLAFSMRQTKEIVGANVYNRAFDNNFQGGDDVSMINAAHPNFAGGTQSNTLAVAADLSEASMEQAFIDIQRWRNDRGLRIALKPKKLIIPTEQQWEAMRLFQSPYRVGGSMNDINTMHGMFGDNIYVNQYLSDPDAWFIRTDAMDGPTHFIRRGADFTIDNDFDSENAKYKATERYSFGWTDWRGVYGSPGV